MKFINYFTNKTALCMAIEDGNVEIVKLLLSSDKINVNLPNI